MTEEIETPVPPPPSGDAVRLAVEALEKIFSDIEKDYAAQFKAQIYQDGWINHHVQSGRKLLRALSTAQPVNPPSAERVEDLYEEIIGRHISRHHDKRLGGYIVPDLYKEGVRHGLEAALSAPEIVNRVVGQETGHSEGEKYPDKAATCPDGLSCSGDGWDCVGDAPCKPGADTGWIDGMKRAMVYRGNDLDAHSEIHNDRIDAHSRGWNAALDAVKQKLDGRG